MEKINQFDRKHAFNKWLEVKSVDNIRIHHHFVSIKCSDRKQPIPQHLGNMVFAENRPLCTFHYEYRVTGTVRR